MAGRQHDFAMILQLILEQYRLPIHGDHGIYHWARVWTNGHAIASQTDADLEIVSLFALFHDACRENDSCDDVSTRSIFAVSNDDDVKK